MSNFLRNWKTTLLGITTIGMAVLSYVNDPKKVDPITMISQIGAGIGLVTAKDANKTGVAPKQ